MSELWPFQLQHINSVELSPSLHYISIKYSIDSLFSEHIFNIAFPLSLVSNRSIQL